MSQSFVTLFLMICAFVVGWNVASVRLKREKELTEVAFQKQWRRRAGEDMGGWR